MDNAFGRYCTKVVDQVRSIFQNVRSSSNLEPNSSGTGSGTPDLILLNNNRQQTNNNLMIQQQPMLNASPTSASLQPFLKTTSSPTHRHQRPQKNYPLSSGTPQPPSSLSFCSKTIVTTTSSSSSTTSPPSTLGGTSTSFSNNRHHNSHHQYQTPNHPYNKNSNHQPPPPIIPHQVYNHQIINNNMHASTPSIHQFNNNIGYYSSSTSSSAASFGPVTPGDGFGVSSQQQPPSSAIFHSPANRSYSASQTPDSPGGFPRRQHSLNVNHQGVGASARLKLDLNGLGVKNSLAYTKQSASTDLIDKHSLSPRPRPKHLSLSNSQDNMLKQQHQQNGQTMTPKPNSMNLSSSRSGLSLLPFQQFNDHHHHHQANNRFNQNNSPVINSGSGAMNGGKLNLHHSSQQPSFNYHKRPSEIELSRQKSAINIKGKKYDRISENDFKKLETLGAGSFGTVDKMYHKPSKTELAVKIMRRSGNIEDNRSIMRDMEVLQNCDYLYIVRCYGYYIMETEVWIFMELMTTCFDHLIKKLRETQETVPENIIGKVAVSTIHALNYLKKEHNVIHRDIKPSNILIDQQGSIKLCDFGISGHLIDSKAHSRSVGSTAYMAPERIEPPDPPSYDIRADVWSLGLTLVEIAIGQFPYSGWNSDFEILSKVIQEDPPKLPDHMGFSPNFKNFVKRCLIKDFKERPKYNELMEDPFYRFYEKANIDVAQWFKQAYCDKINNAKNIIFHFNFQPKDKQQDRRSISSSSSSLASNSTIK